MMGEIFVYILIAFVAIIFVGMLYDNLRCRHEWKETSVRVYCKKRQCTVDALCLTCEKCGKVKVIK